MLWKFNTYISGTGRSVIQTEINEVGDVVKEHFLVRLRYLMNVNISDWHRPYAAKLSGVKDVYEIRFKADNKQYRPMGFFGPGKNEFTIVVWAIEKGKIYNPHDAVTLSERRRKDVEGGKASCTCLQIHGRDFPAPEE
jgi:hypothetical protein